MKKRNGVEVGRVIWKFSGGEEMVECYQCVCPQVDVHKTRRYSGGRWMTWSGNPLRGMIVADFNRHVGEENRGAFIWGFMYYCEASLVLSPVLSLGGQSLVIQGVEILGYLPHLGPGNPRSMCCHGAQQRLTFLFYTQSTPPPPRPSTEKQMYAWWTVAWCLKYVCVCRCWYTCTCWFFFLYIKILVDCLEQHQFVSAHLCRKLRVALCVTCGLLNWTCNLPIGGRPL